MKTKQDSDTFAKRHGLAALSPVARALGVFVPKELHETPKTIFAQQTLDEYTTFKKRRDALKNTSNQDERWKLLESDAGSCFYIKWMTLQLILQNADTQDERWRVFRTAPCAHYGFAKGAPDSFKEHYSTLKGDAMFLCLFYSKTFKEATEFIRNAANASYHSNEAMLQVAGHVKTAEQLDYINCRCRDRLLSQAHQIVQGRITLALHEAASSADWWKQFKSFEKYDLGDTILYFILAHSTSQADFKKVFEAADNSDLKRLAALKLESALQPTE